MPKLPTPPRTSRVVGTVRSLGLAALATLITACATPEPTLDLTDAEWLEDLDYLVETIEDDHIAPFHRITREEFDARVADLRLEMTSLPAHARAVRLMGLAAQIGDGHTNVQLMPVVGGLPVAAFWFGDEMRVVVSDDAHAQWLGWTVTAIGTTPIEEAASRLTEFIPQGESPTLVRNWTAGFARRCDVLATAGLCDGPDAAQWTLRHDDGRVEQVTFQSVPAGTSWVGYHQARSSQPLRNRHPDTPLWFTRVPDSGIVYLRFAGYPSRDDVEDIAEALAQELDDPGVRHLLVDFRGNSGGDFSKGQLLIEEIRSTVTGRGIVVVVAIGRETESAAVSNACHIHDAFDARYVGEVSGGRPNGYQETGAFFLPNSHLSCSVAQEHYVFQDVDSDGIQPDVSLPPHWETYAAGRDPVLDWMLAEDRAAE